MIEISKDVERRGMDEVEISRNLFTFKVMNDLPLHHGISNVNCLCTFTQAIYLSLYLHSDGLH